MARRFCSVVMPAWVGIHDLVCSRERKRLATRGQFVAAVPHLSSNRPLATWGNPRWRQIFPTAAVLRDIPPRAYCGVTAAPGTAADVLLDVLAGTSVFTMLKPGLRLVLGTIFHVALSAAGDWRMRYVLPEGDAVTPLTLDVICAVTALSTASIIWAGVSPSVMDTFAESNVGTVAEPNVISSLSRATTVPANVTIVLSVPVLAAGFAVGPVGLDSPDPRTWSPGSGSGAMVHASR